MQFDELDLIRAQKEGIISAETFDKLIEYLKKTKIKAGSNNTNVVLQNNNSPKLNVENFLYYLGGFIIISTMVWYLFHIWDKFSHIGLLILSILYFMLFVKTGDFLFEKNKKTPSGILYVCAVCIVPVLFFAIESMVGILPKDINRYSDTRFAWILMELSTIIVGLVFFKKSKFSLLTLD